MPLCLTVHVAVPAELVVRLLTLLHAVDPADRRCSVTGMPATVVLAPRRVTLVVIGKTAFLATLLADEIAVVVGSIRTVAGAPAWAASLTATTETVSALAGFRPVSVVDRVVFGKVATWPVDRVTR